MSDEITFRDFAGAIMGGDAGAASTVLETLLQVDADQARAATAFFQEQMSGGPDFMMKAMGMRYAVEAKDEAKLVGLLEDCFGLGDDLARNAAQAVLARYSG